MFASVLPVQKTVVNYCRLFSDSGVARLSTPKHIQDLARLIWGAPKWFKYAPAALNKRLFRDATQKTGVDIRFTLNNCNVDTLNKRTYLGMPLRRC